MALKKVYYKKNIFTNNPSLMNKNEGWLFSKPISIISGKKVYNSKTEMQNDDPNIYPFINGTSSFSRTNLWSAIFLGKYTWSKEIAFALGTKVVYSSCVAHQCQGKSAATSYLRNHASHQLLHFPWSPLMCLHAMAQLTKCPCSTCHHSTILQTSI
jgi:hypothetical protein